MRGAESAQGFSMGKPQSPLWPCWRVSLATSRGWDQPSCQEPQGRPMGQGVLPPSRACAGPSSRLALHVLDPGNGLGTWDPSHPN